MKNDIPSASWSAEGTLHYRGVHLHISTHALKMQSEAATSHMIFTSDVENTDSLYGELISPALNLISYCMKHE